MIQQHSADGVRVKHRRSTGVSVALRALQLDEPGTETFDVSAGADGPSFKIRIAANQRTRERAYRLAHDVYARCGFLANSSGLCVAPYDAARETITILAEDSAGTPAATITLVSDSDRGLPCDEIYGAETAQLRAQNRRLIEVTRLVISEAHARNRVLLVKMFNLIFIFARRIRNADDFVIEVHPRHADYYRRLLLFERIGPERSCPRVAGSPAVLLRLDLETCEREVARLAGVGRNAQERSLYPLAFDLNKEQAALDFLKRNLRPMSEDEMRYFGLKPQSSAALTALAG